MKNIANSARRLQHLIPCICLLFIVGCGSPTFVVRVAPSQQVLQETVLPQHSNAGWFDHDKIVIIDVDGVLVNQAETGLLQSGENPVSLFTEKLRAAEFDSNVRAVVLRLNSPGGTVAASDLMYHELQSFRQRTGIPVIACMLDVAASGAYYLACGTDGIVAQPSTITGSIGTIMQTISFAGTMEHIGVRAEAITSGQLKDLASPLHDLRDDERQVLNTIVMQFYENFLNVVLAGRPALDRAQLEPLADGRVFTAEDALQANLIDQIGYPTDAIEWAKQLAGIQRARVVIYHRPIGYASTIYANNPNTAPSSLVNIELPAWLTAQPGAQFLYLWQAGNINQ
ncbi:MAG: signal peptide peptidase SppA [Sedimentisphaerales bacterium]|nr:signal peptide peptidase SppA [Sedimentisphaerales bacterium]